MNWLTFWSTWFHPSFKWICAARSLAFHVVFCRSLLVHFRVTIVLSVHLQFTAFDYPFAHYIVWPLNLRRPSWSWSYGSWIYNYLRNQGLSPLKFWIRIPLRRGVLDTTLCDKVSRWLATSRWISSGIPVSSTNKTDRHDIAEIFLKVALNTINHKPYTILWYL